MSDYNSSLPIRTESAGDAVIKVCDATVTTQQLKVNSDGSIDANVSATNLDIRDLSHVSDSVKIGDGTDLLEVNNDGSINAVVSATDLDIRNLNATNDAVTAHLKDENGNAFTSANPLPVEFFETQTEIKDYNPSSSTASGASVNHDYTTTANFKLFDVLCSASGKAKFEIQIESGPASGVFGTVATLFNSTANPNAEAKFTKGLNVLSGAKVRVIKTNKDNQAQDLYSSIVGVN